MPQPLRATYRLQLGPGLGFAEVRELVPYLRELGISHLYLSPSLQARSGSTHGYDVVDPTRISDALGGEDGLRALAAEGLPIILDIVPNHMGTGDENRWWSDPELRERFFDIDPAGGYRRFFDIDDMAAIRQERDEVFVTTHTKVLQLVREGVLDGLRVDHPDGLADPAGYLRRLRDEGVARVWVEKILAPQEALRDWAVTGTVGYEFLNDVAGLFIDATALGPLTALLAEVTGEARPFAEIALEAQLQQTAGPFTREVARLQRLASFSIEEIAQALAALPIYRTYVESWSGLVEDADRDAVIEAGLGNALEGALLLHPAFVVDQEFVTRFQQTSPAITAKGIEDTAFYRYLRLLSLNEVGGEPDRFGVSVDEFHAANEARALHHPEGLLITQTHDTKRSGDSRARVGALSTMPREWRERVLAWMAIGDGLRGPGPAPDRSEEYLLYQTLLGVWPVERERLDAYLIKALREAKRNTNWMEPDEAWEAGVLDFAHRMMGSEAFLTDFEPFAERVALAGERSSLGQLLLKLTSPGVPDIFQGDELWRLSMVDPDNRRPVDWAQRRVALAAVRAGGVGPAGDRAMAKLRLIVAALALRSRRVSSFAGGYSPVAAGPDVCAFRRGDDGGDVLVLVALGRAAEAGSGSPVLAEGVQGRWVNVLDGREWTLAAGQSVDAVVDRDGLALLERV